jgi:hypothetical protein
MTILALVDRKNKEINKKHEIYIYIYIYKNRRQTLKKITTQQNIISNLLTNPYKL